VKAIDVMFVGEVSIAIRYWLFFRVCRGETQGLLLYLRCRVGGMVMLQESTGVFVYEALVALKSLMEVLGVELGHLQILFVVAATCIRISADESAFAALRGVSLSNETGPKHKSIKYQKCTCVSLNIALIADARPTKSQ
jgi:hypothetical protein